NRPTGHRPWRLPRNRPGSHQDTIPNHGGHWSRALRISGHPELVPLCTRSSGPMDCHPRHDRAFECLWGQPHRAVALPLELIDRSPAVRRIAVWVLGQLDACSRSARGPTTEMDLSDVSFQVTHPLSQNAHFDVTFAFNAYVRLRSDRSAGAMSGEDLHGWRWLRQFGPPEVLAMGEAPDPTPAEGQAGGGGGVLQHQLRRNSGPCWTLAVPIAPERVADDPGQRRRRCGRRGRKRCRRT